MGSFLMMGLFGLIIAERGQYLPAEHRRCNGRCRSSASASSPGLTAWDTQSIKARYFAGDGYEMAQKKSVYGALQLYLDFINIFTALMQLTGDRR